MNLQNEFTLLQAKNLVKNSSVQITVKFLYIVTYFILIETQVLCVIKFVSETFTGQHNESQM